MVCYVWGILSGFLRFLYQFSIVFIAVFIIFTVVFIERVEIKTERKFGISFIFACTIVSFVLFNYCVEKLSDKVQMTFDMSQNGVFELSDETENYLDSLKENINISHLMIIMHQNLKLFHNYVKM